ncbi:hypothetical protein [Pajaroellobacter abortibovis]|uniref:Uncharacterized protein n=1 Tax=Pajaroellobacter abortibovis TaxID=1882918 RepID=A0A1L6MVA4_9BACT|nr:hypothetical protein [Pajaroellobacter abortibovis]APR99450.1 hypothetical protein BCY86_01205 [Pajaroellobacter abortibovis]
MIEFSPPPEGLIGIGSDCVLPLEPYTIIQIRSLELDETSSQSRIRELLHRLEGQKREIKQLRAEVDGWAFQYACREGKLQANQ